MARDECMLSTYVLARAPEGGDYTEYFEWDISLHFVSNVSHFCASHEEYKLLSSVEISPENVRLWENCQEISLSKSWLNTG